MRMLLLIVIISLAVSVFIGMPREKQTQAARFLPVVVFLTALFVYTRRLIKELRRS